MKVSRLKSRAGAAVIEVAIGLLTFMLALTLGMKAILGIMRVSAVENAAVLVTKDIGIGVDPRGVSVITGEQVIADFKSLESSLDTLQFSNIRLCQPDGTGTCSFSSDTTVLRSGSLFVGDASNGYSTQLTLGRAFSLQLTYEVSRYPGVHIKTVVPGFIEPELKQGSIFKD